VEVVRRRQLSIEEEGAMDIGRRFESVELDMCSNGCLVGEEKEESAYIVQRREEVESKWR
jgi:hypothetical protein